jgi:ABC-type dipeptide/oligopeptide/nickel transport system ATPase component
MQAIAYTTFLGRLRGRWKPGQHIAVVGPTGSGKSWAVADILALRKHVVVVATKAKDKTLDERYKQFKTRSSWPAEYDEHKVLFWKKPKRLGDFREQQIAIYELMADVYSRGGYTISFDDLYYVSETLKLKRALQMLYTQIRSQNASIVGNMQRPSWVPLEAINQVTYMLLFKVHDKADVDRIAEGMGLDKRTLYRQVSELKQYEFIFIEVGHEPIKIEKQQGA